MAKAATPKAAPIGTAENPMRTMPVTGPIDPDAPEGGLGGPTERQRAGLDPMDPAANAEEAEHRRDLPNMQTTHERENALDPVSGGPSPGITEATPLTGEQQGQTKTDMSGRPPMPLDEKEKEAFPRMRELLAKAAKDDKNDDKKPDNLKGFRTPAEMGIPGAVVSRILDAADPDQKRVERQQVPNGAFFPETGTRYRLR